MNNFNFFPSFKDGSGDPCGFKNMLRNDNLPMGTFVRYVGNRIHVLFHLAGILVLHHSRVKKFLETECTAGMDWLLNMRSYEVRGERIFWSRGHFYLKKWRNNCVILRVRKTKFSNERHVSSITYLHQKLRLNSTYFYIIDFIPHSVTFGKETMVSAA